MSCRQRTHSSKPRFPAAFLESRVIMMVYTDARLGVCTELCTLRIVSLILWPVQPSFASITYVSVRPGTSLFLFTSTPCQSYNAEINPLHFLSVCVCVCVCVWLTTEHYKVLEAISVEMFLTSVFHANKLQMYIHALC